MLSNNSIKSCNDFVRDMNELSAHWHFKVVRFTDTFAVVTVKGYVLNKNLLEDDDEVVLDYVMALVPSGPCEYEICLLEDSTDDVIVSRLKSTYRSGFEAAGAVAASVALHNDRKLFFNDNGRSVAKELGFL